MSCWRIQLLLNDENYRIICWNIYVLHLIVTGWLYDKTSSYAPSFYMAGGWMALSGLMMLPLIRAPKAEEKTSKPSNRCEETCTV